MTWKELAKHLKIWIKKTPTDSLFVCYSVKSNPETGCFFFKAKTLFYRI